VNLAWPRAGAPPTRIPLPPRTNNTSEETPPVYRSTLDGSGRVMKGAPPTPSSLRRRFLDKFTSSPPADVETSRLLPPTDVRDEGPSVVNQMQSTLERLQKFKFGGNSSSEDKSVPKKKSGDKTEKLRELTDILRGRSDRKKPPTSPPSRNSKAPGWKINFGSTTSLTGTSKDTTPSRDHKRAASVTSVASSDPGHVSPTPHLSEVDRSNTLPEDPPPEEDDGSCSPRAFATRSASFSQGDYNSLGGKYRKSGARRNELPKAMTFPRKTHVDAATSASPPPEERTSSTPSVDSAVGSDEGFGVAPSMFLTGGSDPPKTSGGRSLTYPLGAKKLDISGSPLGSNCVRSLHVSRELTDVTEEGSSDLLSVTPAEPETLNCNSNIDSSHNEIMLPLENLGREIDELLDQKQVDMPKSPEIYITTWPKTNDDYEYGAPTGNRKKKLTLNCDLIENPTGVSDDNKTDDAEVVCNNCQRWSGETDSSQSTKEGGSEPMSPEETSMKPTWPKSRKGRLTCQSSEEHDDDRNSPRKHGQPLSRHDSLSDAESDLTERYGSVPRTCSPSPHTAYDFSDSESKGKRTTHPPRRYSKRPLRGPYGQMLEAEMKNTKKLQDELNLLEGFSSSIRPSLESRSESPRPRANTAWSLDDSHLRGAHSMPVRSNPKRKVSANIPYSAEESRKDEVLVSHQRTTSSPSQLGSCASNDSKDHEPSQELLATLLKGSSERACRLDEGERNRRTNSDCKVGSFSFYLVRLD